jgi:hypothetical protein
MSEWVCAIVCVINNSGRQRIDGSKCTVGQPEGVEMAATAHLTLVAPDNEKFTVRIGRTCAEKPTTRSTPPTAVQELILSIATDE